MEIKLALWIEKLPDEDKVAIAEALTLDPITASQTLESYRGLMALQVLRNLNDVFQLGDLIYQVRDSEGEGWDGPRVKKWANAIEIMDSLIKD